MIFFNIVFNLFFKFNVLCVFVFFRTKIKFENQLHFLCFFCFFKQKLILKNSKTINKHTLNFQTVS